jgi:hypothetical protein
MKMMFNHDKLPSRQFDSNQFGLSKKELRILSKLNTPIKVQNFLDKLPINQEEDGETNMSPRRVLREKKAHCIEGALLAWLALYINGEKTKIIELKTPGEAGHIVTLYKRHGLWGAISKTNHNALRFRDPVYRSIRELVMSYFHECTNDKTGKKVLRSYSGPFDPLKRWGSDWIISEKNLDDIAEDIFDAPEKVLVPDKNLVYVRNADGFERKVGRMVEW